MAINIKSLLKKGKLTGDEVGRLMIKDLAVSYKNVLENRQIDGILTDQEKILLVDGLEKSEDIRRYRQYRVIHEFLERSIILFSLYTQAASNSLWKTYHIITTTYHAESSYSSENRNYPKIVTQKQFDDMKQEKLEEQLNLSWSLELLIIHVVEYHLRRYEAGKRTPFNKHFKACKEKAISNNRIKENYWEDNGYYTLPDGRRSKDMSDKEWAEALDEYEAYAGMIEATRGGELTREEILKNKQIRDEAEKPNLEWTSDNTAPENATMFNVLKHLNGFYYSEETDNQDTFFEFMTDFPDLYNAIWEHLTSIETLSFLKDIPKEDYTNCDLISCKNLYDNNILNFKEYFEEFYPDGTLNGLAILQEGIGFRNNVDENGYYKEPNRYWLENYMVESFIVDENIEGLFESIKYNLKYAYAVKEAVKMIGDFIDVPEVNILIGNVNEAEIPMLNHSKDCLIKSIDRFDSKKNKELTEWLIEILVDIDIEDLKPKTENIKAAKEELDFNTFDGGYSGFLDLLAGQEEV